MMLPKKHLSGSEKRKKRKRIEEIVESQKGAIDKFVLKRVEEPSKRLSVDNLEQSNENLNDENHINEDSINLNDHDNVTNHINEDNTYLNEHDNVPNVLMSPLEILELVKVADCYPNVSIAYRILLTVPVTVASAERSFSKLKLLKSYLRSSMSQERLNDLAILCIEKNMLENIDVDTIINDFVSRNARRQCFL